MRFVQIVDKIVGLRDRSDRQELTTRNRRTGNVTVTSVLHPPDPKWSLN